MVWIPRGALVAGTPPDRLPRIADEEIPGEQVILKGFYIDVFPYPDEEGAIPLSNVSRDEAAALCKQAGKRLCSELEWERACKGPENHAYEYGDRYRMDRCATGSEAALRPNGLRVGCRSDFGVFDMHGSVWEWTASPWARGTHGPLVAVRGGNATSGELVGRCANAVARRPETRSGTLGFRCCAGPKNAAEVVFSIKRGKKLELWPKADQKLARDLASRIPDDARKEIGDTRHFVADRMWTWRPIGNEELTLVTGCTGVARDPRCGVLVARMGLGSPRVIAWAPSGRRVPSLHADTEAMDVWLIGGDEMGPLKRRIAYLWGRVNVGAVERNVRPHHKARKRKRR